MFRPLTVAAVLFLSSVPTVSVASEGFEIEPPVTTRYIVGFDGEVPPEVRPGSDYMGGTVVRVDDGLAFAVVETDSPATFKLAADDDERVRYTEWDNPNYAIISLVPNDPRYTDAGHYGTKIIGAEAAWDRALGTTAVKVAVIDSGIRRTHEEFAGTGRILQGYDFDDNDSDPNDNCGHGTHVTGTVGATINNGKGMAGLAQVTILPVKGLDSSLLLCTGSTSALASALRYAGDQGAHLSTNSWGGGGSSSINDAISYAHALGVTHVAAAGNDGACTNCASEPWKTNAAKVIIVASTTSSDAQSSFSSEGPQVDVAAPGSSILSTYNSNDASYNTLSGTSMATPHVTGTLALVKTLQPSFGYVELDDWIKSTAVDLGAAGKDDKFGYGRINAAAATDFGPPPAPQCSDGIDNDGDGLIDYPTDPGCESATDDDETDVAPPPDPQCSDGVDNDGDGLIDYPADPGCESASDDDETNAPPPPPAPQCSDGIDNDGDGLTDYPTDPGCESADDDDETDAPPPPNSPPTPVFSFTTSGLSVEVDGTASSDSDGAIVSYSWDWGDESPTGSGVTANHTYASGGTYSVTLTVTDDGGASGNVSRSVTVTDPADPDPTVPNLSNGEAVSDTSGAKGSEKFYKIQVPLDSESLTVVLDGPTCGLLGCSSDLDLYLKRGARPTDASYDCRPYESDSDETCSFANPAADWWYVRVKVYSGSGASYTVTAEYTTTAPPPNAPPTASFTHSCGALDCSFDASSSTDADGTISSYAWDFGDGTAGSGATLDHTYGSGGTYVVTLTVTDDDGAADSSSTSVTVTDVSDPDPSTPTLANGVARSDSISGAGTWNYYKIQVPAGKPSLTVVLDGPACGLLGCNPDLDLYVKRGTKPTDASYDCRPYESDSDETCTLANPAADWWYVRVKVYSGSASASYAIKAIY